jgi:hypothetical protein
VALSALAARGVLAAGETPVGVLGKAAALRPAAIRSAIEGNPWLPPLPAITRPK